MYVCDGGWGIQWTVGLLCSLWRLFKETIYSSKSAFGSNPHLVGGVFCWLAKAGSGTSAATGRKGGELPNPQKPVEGRIRNLVGDTFGRFAANGALVGARNQTPLCQNGFHIQGEGVWDPDGRGPAEEPHSFGRWGPLILEWGLVSCQQLCWCFLGNNFAFVGAALSPSNPPFQLPYKTDITWF